MAKALVSGGCKATVVCRKGTWKPDDYPDFEPKGNYEGIDYTYTSNSVVRPNGFIARNVQKLKGMIGEYRYLGLLKRQGGLQAAVISNMSVLHVLRYYLYSRMIGFPIVWNFVELASSMKHRDSISKRINDYVLDNWGIKLFDGALPISHKLMDCYTKASPSKPCMKLPIICDFDEFNLKPRDETDRVLLYCGAVSYTELIEFVIDSFEALDKVPENVFLGLVLGGRSDKLQQVQELIGKAQYKDQIRLLNNVPREEIPILFSNASALLIPLRPTAQDEARFPHKIGEYLASGTPLITTAWGEINQYDFLDGETALVAKDFDKGLFAEKMEFVVGNPSKAKEIGLKGQQMGLANFDYSVHGKRLREYFLRFNKKSN